MDLKRKASGLDGSDYDEPSAKTLTTSQLTTAKEFTTPQPTTTNVLECMLDLMAFSGPNIERSLRLERIDAYMLIGKLNQLVCVHLPGNVRSLFDSGLYAPSCTNCCGGKNVGQAAHRLATGMQCTEKAAEEGSIQGISCSDHRKK